MFKSMTEMAGVVRGPADSPYGSGTASEPQRAIAFFGHDSTESTAIKRATTFQALGARVVGFMFRRVRAGPPRVPAWHNVDLGVTADRNYLARLPKLAAGLFTVLRHRRTLRTCQIFYARNIDMALIAVLARFLTRSQAVLAYEVLDVQRVFVGPRLVNMFFRWAERAILLSSDLLVVSSPDFVSRYFAPCQGYRGPWRLLENKVSVSAQQLAVEPKRTEGKPAGPPWVIGWFGTLRCTRSLDMLAAIADRLGEHVLIHIRGVPSQEDLPTARIEQACAHRSNLVYGGPYASPQDLPAIYGGVHFAWCIDYLDAGTNSDWLLPNRIYEGGLFGALALARNGTATARLVEARQLGRTFDEPLEQTVADFIAQLDGENYARSREALAGKPHALFVDEHDTRDLLDQLDRQYALRFAGAGHR